MALCYLGIGSNQSRERNIGSALLALRRNYGEMRLSPIYSSPAVGFTGADFYNLVVEINTELNPQELTAGLQKIEDDQGRDRSAPKFSDRTLDIDLLLYSDWVVDSDGINIPRQDIINQAFVLKPLKMLVPNLIHPGLGVNIAQLWAEFSGDKSSLIKVEL